MLPARLHPRTQGSSEAPDGGLDTPLALVPGSLTGRAPPKSPCPWKTVRLDFRTVGRVRLALVLGAAGAFGLAYLLSVGFRSEVDGAAGTLYRGDVAGLRAYILPFGTWTPGSRPR